MVVSEFFEFAVFVNTLPGNRSSVALSCFEEFDLRVERARASARSHRSVVVRRVALRNLRTAVLGGPPADGLQITEYYLSLN